MPMRAGDVDGKGAIYDYDGHLILRQGESIAKAVTDVNGSVLPRWGRLVRGRAVIDTVSGRGNWFVTNERMVFIRRPNSKGVQRWRTTPLEVAGGVGEILRIRNVLRQGGFDYCEIMYDDVRFYKKYRKGAKMLLMVSGEKYQMYANEDVFEAALPYLKQKGIEQR